MRNRAPRPLDAWFRTLLERSSHLPWGYRTDPPAFAYRCPAAEATGGYAADAAPPHGGTVLRLLAPRERERARRWLDGTEKPAPGAPAVAAGGSERILLVEDDALVRALAVAVLRRAGYQLIVHADPIQAAGEDPRVVDLLVSDITMPGLTGPALAARLRERRPDLPVLFMSGFAEPDVIEQIADLSHRPLLQKPFSPAALLEAVRMALDDALTG